MTWSSKACCESLERCTWRECFMDRRGYHSTWSRRCRHGGRSSRWFDHAVIRNADQQSLVSLAAQTRELAGKAKDRKLSAEEYSNSTFTISNLGMMQIEHFTAIINPPNAAILAVGSMQQEPVVVDGALTVGWRMKVTMTCDHRVIDGALGAEFLQAVRRYIEFPALLA